MRYMSMLIVMTAMVFVAAASARGIASPGSLIFGSSAAATEGPATDFRKDSSPGRITTSAANRPIDAAALARPVASDPSSRPAGIDAPIRMQVKTVTFHT